MVLGRYKCVNRQARAAIFLNYLWFINEMSLVLQFRDSRIVSFSKRDR